MKRIFSILLSVTCFLSITGCSSDTESNKDNESNSKTEEQTNSGSDHKAASDKNVLIAYFSWSGNTEKIANMIHEKTGGDLFQIEPDEAYPKDYDEVVDLAQREQNENARPSLKTNIENFNDYHVIYIGYPNWWGDMPMILYTFLESNNFEGKTVIPFCTHGGSGFSNTPEKIKEVTGAAMQDGLDVRDNAVDDAADTVSAWLENLN